MNKALGTVITAIMTDENDDYYFVQQDKDGVTYSLLKEEVKEPLHVGGQVRGFVYENENHTLQMTLTVPSVLVDHYDYGTVVSVRRDLGVFVDIGLPNKDIVVSIDDLPTIKPLWPQQGDRLLIALKIDQKDRLWGQLADEDVYTAIANRADDKFKNANMQATVYRLKMAGTLVLTDDFYLGFVHPDEREQEPRLGQHVKVRVIGVRPDGTLNLSMKPRAYEAIPDDAAMILAMLEHSDSKQLPYTDKSDPDDIREVFGISKGQFKRAIGHLLKSNLVEQKDGQLVLTK
ncbi:S1 RNA-binding protein [Paucilactobacillus hokkaidonensis JCM 18461]|uniref:S1 RNA-binding protein n=2 Tax=Paucilactobacillus hokkaidonensis TaxID=1193095 RepID=A0A0A1GTW8_9LACO|nr:S1-like domain-containing RNA-binding protein [Paucilactobacillus hokkaidonensis]KRO10700.1 RNA-bindining protein [Paucilactobacillus hokkaidonensis]BAP85692.1 S1 RNA-binding protein [Paucilactobacillus hokkaidonensis JCM 18461]